MGISLYEKNKCTMPNITENAENYVTVILYIIRNYF
jgi:hypothetical protein